MIDIFELMDDEDFAQDFQIIRTSGQFQDEGEWVNAGESTIERIGVIQPAKASDIVNFLPEGERQKKTIAIYCAEDVVMSDGKGVQSDVIVWHGQRYRVAYSKHWQDHGYWFVLATGFNHG